jgi:hypothetical protein
MHGTLCRFGALSFWPVIGGTPAPRVETERLAAFF